MNENEINKIIQEAEQNPQDDYTTFNNEYAEDLTYIVKKINQYGIISTEEF